MCVCVRLYVCWMGRAPPPGVCRRNRSEFSPYGPYGHGEAPAGGGRRGGFGYGGGPLDMDGGIRGVVPSGEQVRAFAERRASERKTEFARWRETEEEEGRSRKSFSFGGRGGRERYQLVISYSPPLVHTSKWLIFSLFVSRSCVDGMGRNGGRWRRR